MKLQDGRYVPNAMVWDKAEIALHIAHCIARCVYYGQNEKLPPDEEICGWILNSIHFTEEFIERFLNAYSDILQDEDCPDTHQGISDWLEYGDVDCIADLNNEIKTLIDEKL